MKFLTMKSYRIQIVSLILMGLISMRAHAEVIPGRWEKVSDLELGAPIIVGLENGDQVEGTFEGLSESEVDVETHTARAVVPKTDIQTITTRERGGVNEGAKNGAMVGASVGVALALVTIVMSGASDLNKKGLALMGGMTLGLSTAIGTALGAAAAAGTEREAIVVYKAPRDPSTSIN